MRYYLERRGDQRTRVQPTFEQVGENVVIASTQWLPTDAQQHERFQVISWRDGRIADVEGCASRREAERVARRQSRSA